MRRHSSPMLVWFMHPRDVEVRRKGPNCSNICDVIGWKKWAGSKKARQQRITFSLPAVHFYQNMTCPDSRFGNALRARLRRLQFFRFKPHTHRTGCWKQVCRPHTAGGVMFHWWHCFRSHIHTCQLPASIALRREREKAASILSISHLG